MKKIAIYSRARELGILLGALCLFACTSPPRPAVVQNYQPPPPPPPQTRVDFQSEPPGARLYVGDKYYGFTPMSLFWPASGVLEAAGHIGPTKVYWDDGAKAETDLRLRPSGGPASNSSFANVYTVLLEHPDIGIRRSQPQQQQQQQQQQVIIIPK
jgi:hypothetical protein